MQRLQAFKYALMPTGEQQRGQFGGAVAEGRQTRKSTTVTMIEPIAANVAAAVSIDNQAVTPAATAGDTPGIRARPASSTEIRVSAPGHALAGGGQAPAVRDNSDVDNSGLPDQAKDAIKRLRELRAQLERKLQELEAVKNATTGTPDQKRIRISALEQEIAGLGAAINSTTATLNQASASSPPSRNWWRAAWR